MVALTVVATGQGRGGPRPQKERGGSVGGMSPKFPWALFLPECVFLLRLGRLGAGTVSRVYLGTRGRRWSCVFSGGIGKGDSPYRLSVKTNGSPLEAHVSSCASYAGAGEGFLSYSFLKESGSNARGRGQ